MTSWGPFDLTGKNAVVTGGAMGIGFGIARRFVEAGANVVIGDLNAAAAQEAAAKLADGPGKAIAMAADVSQVGAGEALVDTCVEALARWTSSSTTPASTRRFRCWR